MPKNKPKLELYRDALKQIAYIDAHGCCDGDCPHEDIAQCYEALIKELRFVGETVRAVLEESK